MNYKIALIRGDGIGPEVVNEAVKVMERVGEKFGHSLTYTDVLLGGCATDAVGKSYPDGTAQACKACDAVLLGAVGGPSGGRTSPPNNARRPLCWPSAAIWGCTPICAPPPCAPPWPTPVPCAGRPPRPAST